MINSKYIIIFVGIAIIISIGIFFIFKSPSLIQTPLNITELPNETSLVLAQNQNFKFKLKDNESQLIINSISENSINITIKNNFGIFFRILNINETQSFDFDDNNIADISITLNNITSGKANLSIIKIICEENWDCEDWSICIGSNQTRTCEDKNQCGTEKDKPVEFQICKTCSEQAGIFCKTAEICNGTELNTLNGKCCLGNCIIKPIILCSDMDCLISASQNCDIANLTYQSKFFNNTFQTITFYYKIKGIKDEKCQLYKEIIGVANYTQSAELIGKNGICRFSTYNLKDYLTEVKESDYQLTADDIANYECIGSLYGI